MKRRRFIKATCAGVVLGASGGGAWLNIGTDVNLLTIDKPDKPDKARFAKYVGRF